MTERKLVLSNNGQFAEVAYFDSDKPDDLQIKTFEDMEPIIERARALSALTPGKDIRHAAVVPQHVLDKAYREGWFNDQDKWREWANDPANACFRTWPGRL